MKEKQCVYIFVLKGMMSLLNKEIDLEMKRSTVMPEKKKELCLSFKILLLV